MFGDHIDGFCDWNFCRVTTSKLTSPLSSSNVVSHMGLANSAESLKVRPARGDGIIAISFESLYVGESITETICLKGVPALCTFGSPHNWGGAEECGVRYNPFQHFTSLLHLFQHRINLPFYPGCWIFRKPLVCSVCKHGLDLPIIIPSIHYYCCIPLSAGRWWHPFVDSSQLSVVSQVGCILEAMRSGGSC